jgi:2,4-dienoyl-CoA reductase (NADPH2)
VISFAHLLRPGRIGGMAVRNRLVMSPMETMYGTPDGLPSARACPPTPFVVAGAPEPDTAMFDTLVSAMPDAEVHVAGDCTGQGLIRKATEDGARAACAI